MGEHLPGDLMLVGAPRLPPAFPVRGVWQGAGQELKYFDTGGDGQHSAPAIALLFRLY